MLSLDTQIEKISGIGPISQKKLKRLRIKTVNDLLFHFPCRYDDFSNVLPISKVKINEVCTISGKVLEIKSERTWKKHLYITHAIIEDKTGAIKTVWFNRPYLNKIIKKGDNLFVSGKITISKNEVCFQNPVYEKKLENDNLTHTGRLVPVYPGTTGLTSRWFRYILKPILTELKDKIPETLPQKLIKENNLPSVSEALWQVHFPDLHELAQKAQKRFSFEELFFIELFVLRERAKLSKEKAIPFEMNVGLIKRFVDSLPFKLTDAQRKTSYRILKDLEKPRPMNRLLEGDVGSGKTVVAAIAALNVAKKGYQVAFMAPTEILTKQHFFGVAKLLENFNLDIGLLTGKQDQFISRKLKNQTIEISRKKMLEKTLSGELNILIGTHALIQKRVKFGKLALVVLDEQHRFGVEQRSHLCKRSNGNLQKRIIPHLLSMTATPIPRTLALTIYGDLDLSLLDELPKGRKKIITKIIGQEKRKETYSFIKKEIKKGRQVFVICPKIEKKEKNGNEKKGVWDDVKAVKEEHKKLSQEIFPDLNVEMIHGKIPVKEKEKIMRNMKNKKIDILVSTSVIEVGIDIPNASVMMIEGAERFGLAQLHQFRGRVGRARYQSYCFLFTTSPDQLNRQRLKALVESESGFKLAQIDLEIRGPGSFTGTRQWGIPDLMMDSLKDMKLVEKTREAAKEILTEDPLLKKYPLIEARLKKFGENIHLE
jgi:ATP-dependent DNA helicase RecG